MASMLDFRALDEGLGGSGSKKRAREEEEERIVELFGHEDQQPTKRGAIAMEEDEDKPVFGRPTYDGTIGGKVSGRKYKTVKNKRASAIVVKPVTRKNFEQRQKEREIKKAYTERMTELKESIRLNKQEKRRKAEERKKKIAENDIKGAKVQKITNPKTLKKMSKKERSKLRYIPD